MSRKYIPTDIESFIKGFNSGYILAKHSRTLVDNVLKSLRNQNDYILGIQSGIMNYDSELKKRIYDVGKTAFLRTAKKSSDSQKKESGAGFLLSKSSIMKELDLNENSFKKFISIHKLKKFNIDNEITYMIPIEKAFELKLSNFMFNRYNQESKE